MSMKDNDKNKKSKASDIIRMIRERQSQKDQSETSIDDAILRRKAEREKEDWQDTFNEWLNSMPTPPENISSRSVQITYETGGGQTCVDNKPFHEFKELKPAMNALGLYREIMEEIEVEDNPKALKAFFSDRLQQILENVDDTEAFAISRKIKGIE